MGNKNYSKFSKHFNKTENNEVTNNPVYEEEVIQTVEEYAAEVEQEEVKELSIGVVSGCEKLNVRERPSKDAKVLCAINKNDEVKVDLYHEGEPVPSDVSFYKVITATGVEGYCMAKYILVK